MAPQQIMRLNLGDTDQLLNLMGFQRPKTENHAIIQSRIARPLKDKFHPNWTIKS